jgi:uncharacterized membrane protein
MKLVAKSGVALAAAAFSLAVTGVAFTTAPAFAADTVKCQGVNACKGQGSCKSTSHSCKGLNACKGQGWISASAEKCKALGGKVLKG